MEIYEVTTTSPSCTKSLSPYINIKTYIIPISHNLCTLSTTQQAHTQKMQRWALGLECPSFKTIDKINKVKYVSSLFWLCSRSWSIPSSNLLQLSSITAALPPRVYILNRSVSPSAKENSTSTNYTVLFLMVSAAVKNKTSFDTSAREPSLKDQNKMWNRCTVWYPSVSQREEFICFDY